MDCIIQCFLQYTCRSANFRKNETCEEQENCELLATVYSEEPHRSLKKDENYDYYILINPEWVSMNIVKIAWEQKYNFLQQNLELVSTFHMMKCS